MHSITASFKPDSSGTGPKQLGYIPNLKLNDGNEIPLFGYGLGSARSRDEAEKTMQVTVTAINNGYYHLDGAQSYKNETELGAAIKKSGVDRSKLFVTTKLQNMNKDVPAAFAASLERLGLDYVDLYLIHAPFGASSPEHLQQTWAALEAIQRRAAHGPSGCPTSSCRTLRRTSPTGSWPSAARARSRRGVRPADRRAQGAPGPCDDAYAELAAKYGVSEADVALRWCIDQGIVAITTSASEQRLKGYMNRLPAFKLTPKEIERIAEEGKKKHYRGYWLRNFAEDDRR
ncbi:hypothetical protein EKO27_g1393 [Xylaria grammica]|uniref:NADP-dependent oxidoreductase domain-containing protein n=1 Tax=Xylaria grammica TaxID=363999 RepID=A0A439DH60_9PEZI|nr:hypothetical protein EKO27_g1393 [Xylaria grammica]